MYTVVLYNDNVTPYDFVIRLLVEVFEKNLKEAQIITDMIHSSIAQPVATYTKQIAEQKLREAHMYIDHHNYVLKVSLEKDM